MRWPVAALLVCTACAAHPAGVPATQAASLPAVLPSVGGRVVVTDLDLVRYARDGVHCVAIGRYADVRTGARVELSGPRHNTAAVTRLGPGTLRSSSSGRPGCAFRFFTTSVPNRHPVFLVYVGGQRPVRVDPQALAAGTAVVRLG